MKRSLTVFGIVLLVQTILSAPVSVEEPVDLNPEVRGLLDSIISAVFRPILNGLAFLGQGVVDPGTLLSSALNEIAGTGGNLVNNPLGPLNPVHNVQRDAILLEAVKALVDEINSGPSNVPTHNIQNDPMTLLDAFLNNDLKNVNDEEETPLYLVVG